MNNQGITSLSRPKSLDESYGAMQQKMGQAPRASQAVNKALDNITPMLSKLDNKTLGLLLQLTQYLKDHKSKYKELMAKLAAKGSIPAGVFPDKYDPKFLSVFALSVAHAQQSREGMAAGGIADVAQHMKDQGRGKDTMLAHISPKEAELLRANGGVGTLNPTTGLPEFNIFDDIGDGLKGFGDFIGDVLRPVGNVIGDILRSPIGLAATAAAGMYFLGTPTVSALASSALPGDAALAAALPGDAVLAAAPEVMHLTPAAIEAGMGTPGYGFNASAAESGLFNLENIGAGAASDFPTSGLTAKDILKKGKDLLGKDSEQSKQSDPNEMIKLMAMLEMINSQNQPKDLPIAKLPDNSQLPYDSPAKKKSAYPSYVQTAADGGLMMDQRYGIGGVTADRTQTDYMKQMLDSKYRPGQGGITYFSPLVYKPLTAKDVLPGQDTAKQTAIDDLLNQVSKGTRSGSRYDSNEFNTNFSGGYPGYTTDIYGDSGPLTGMADYMNKLAASLGSKGFTKLSDVIAKNVDSNYGHEGKVGLRKAEAAAQERLLNALNESQAETDRLNRLNAKLEPKQGAYIPGTGPLIAPYPYTNEAFNAGLTDASGNPISGAGEAFNAGLTDASGNPESVGLPSLDNESQAETNRLNAANAQVDPNYGHEGRVGIRQAAANVMANAPNESQAETDRLNRLNAKLEPKQGAYIPGTGPLIAPDPFKQGAYIPGTGPLIAPDPFAGQTIAQINAKRDADILEFRQILDDQQAKMDRESGHTERKAEQAKKAEQERLAGLDSYYTGVTDSGGFAPVAAPVVAAPPAPPPAAPPPAAPPAAPPPPAPPPTFEGGEFSASVGGGGGGGRYSGDNSGDNGGWGRRDAGAQGGYLSNGGFDRHYAYGGITSLAEGGDTEEELRKRRSGGRGLSAEQQAERDDPKAWANLTDEQKTEYYSNNPGMLGFSEGALNFWSGSPLGRLQNYFDPSRQDTQRKILETARADAARYGKGSDSSVSSGSLSSQIRGQDKANLRDLPYDAPVSGITSLNTKNPYVKNALLSNSKEEIDKKLSLFNQGINPETGDSKVASGFNDIKNNTAAFLGNLGLTSLSDSIAKTVNSDYGHEGAVGLRMAEQAAQERAAREDAVERVVEQLERTEPPPAYGGTSYGSVAPGYTGGSEAARGGLLDSRYAHGGITALAQGGYNLGSYSDGGRLLRGPGDGVSDDIPAMIGNKQPARLANGEFVIPARIVSELGNGSTDAGAKRLYEMMARIQKVRRKTKNVAANTKAAKYLPA